MIIPCLWAYPPYTAFYIPRLPLSYNSMLQPGQGDILLTS
jgi:hypothetical protein